ncbi:hypothetical protein KPH14_013136, partial [Odynerus spinipes]
MIIVRTKIRSKFLRLLFNLYEYSPSNFRQIAFYDFSKEPFQTLLDDSSHRWLKLVRESSISGHAATAGSSTKASNGKARALEFDEFCKMLLQQLSHELIGFNCLTRFEARDTNDSDSYALTMLFLRYWQFVTIFRKYDKCCSKFAAKILTLVSRPMLAVSVHVLNDESSPQRLNAWAVLVDLVLRQPRLVLGNRAVNVVDTLDEKLSLFFEKWLHPNSGRSTQLPKFTSRNFLGRFPFPEEVLNSNLFRYLLYLQYRGEGTTLDANSGKVSFLRDDDTLFDFDILDTKFVHRFDCAFVTEYLNNLLQDTDYESSTRLYGRSSYLIHSTNPAVPSLHKCHKKDRNVDIPGVDAFSFVFLYMIFSDFRTFLTINQFDRPLAAIKESLFGTAGSVNFIVQNTMTCDLLAAEALYTFHLDINDPVKSASSSSSSSSLTSVRRYDVFGQDFNEIGCNNEFWSSEIRSYSFFDNDYGTLRSSTVYSLAPSVLRPKHRNIMDVSEVMPSLTYQQYLVVFCLFYNLREYELPTSSSIDAKFPKLVAKKSFDQKYTVAALLTFLQHHHHGNLSAIIRLLELRRTLYYRARRQFFALIESNGGSDLDFGEIDLLDETTLESDAVPHFELLFLRFVLTMHQVDVRKQVEFFFRPIHRKCEPPNTVDEYFETSLHALRSMVANLVTSLWLKSNFPTIVADETKRNLKLRHKNFYEYVGALKKYVEVWCTDARKSDDDSLERYKDVGVQLTATFLAMQAENLPEFVNKGDSSIDQASSSKLLKIITGNRFTQSWRTAVIFIPTVEISQTFHEIPNVDGDVYAVFLEADKNVSGLNVTGTTDRSTSTATNYNPREVIIPRVINEST